MERGELVLAKGGRGQEKRDVMLYWLCEDERAVAGDMCLNGDRLYMRGCGVAQGCATPRISLVVV